MNHDPVSCSTGRHIVSETNRTQAQPDLAGRRLAAGAFIGPVWRNAFWEL